MGQLVLNDLLHGVHNAVPVANVSASTCRHCRSLAVACTWRHWYTSPASLESQEGVPGVWHGAALLFYSVVAMPPGHSELAQRSNNDLARPLVPKEAGNEAISESTPICLRTTPGWLSVDRVLMHTSCTDS